MVVSAEKTAAGGTGKAEAGTGWEIGRSAGRGAKESFAGECIIDSSQGESEGVMAVINDVIGLLQLAGTGISVVTITLLGAKYMLSSVEQKAEIKNRAMPVVIGCVILFGAVNLVAIVANFTNAVLKE